MTYKQKLVVTLVLAVAAYVFVPVPVKAVATLLLGSAAGYFKAKSETYD